VIVSPSTPVGPGDVKPTPTGQLVLDAAAGRMPAYVDTGLNIVHVDDVALGHLLAYERGAAGERYILGGQDMSLREILGMIAGLTGRTPPRVRLPYGVVLPRLCGGGVRQALRAQRAHHPGGRAHVAQEDVFFERQSGARIGLSMAPTGAGFRGRDSLVSRQRIVEIDAHWCLHHAALVSPLRAAMILG
jgi:hypothetical protein